MIKAWSAWGARLPSRANAILCTRWKPTTTVVDLCLSSLFSFAFVSPRLILSKPSRSRRRNVCWWDRPKRSARFGLCFVTEAAAQSSSEGQNCPTHTGRWHVSCPFCDAALAVYSVHQSIFDECLLPKTEAMTLTVAIIKERVPCHAPTYDSSASWASLNPPVCCTKILHKLSLSRKDPAGCRRQRFTAKFLLLFPSAFHSRPNPLEAMKVSIGHRSELLFRKVLENIENDTILLRMGNCNHLGDSKTLKTHPVSLNLLVKRIATDRKVFAEIQKKGRSVKHWLNF